MSKREPDVENTDDLIDEAQMSFADDDDDDDEEEEVVTYRPRARARTAAVPTNLLQLKLWQLVAFVVLAFVAGFLVRDYTSSDSGAGQAPVNQQQKGPALTDEQLRDGMPTGHPNVGGNGVAPQPAISATPTAPAASPLK